MSTAQDDLESLRIFVAMPGSDMGPEAAWKDPDQVKRRFYEVIADRVHDELGRPVDLVIEKEKHLAGPIYASMYSEAWTADVYLADLTGANANVYLELGVRWAMSDGVTILLAQDPTKLKFNVAAARAEPYSSDPDLLEHSINRVVKSILAGLKVKTLGGTDSPVRQAGKVQSIATDELLNLRAELERLRSERGEDYLDAAATASTLQTRVDLLRRAVEVNPLIAESRFQLGQALRETGTADAEAIGQLERAAHLSPDNANYWRELGVALSKSGRPGDAISALERSCSLDPSDFDSVSVLGGAQRRLALVKAPQEVEWELLQASRDSYERASKIAPRDTYPILNVARIDLLLSRLHPDRGVQAKARFRKALPLCEFEWEEAKEAAAGAAATLAEKQKASFKAFDYADCHLLSGDISSGVEAYRRAIASTPVELRRDIFRSVMAGLDNIDAIAILDSEYSEAIQVLRALLQAG